MRLLENFRNHKGISAVRERVERARDEWNDVERRIRQRMRVYPEKLRARLSARSRIEITPEPENQNRGLAATAAAGAGENQQAKPIVSIRERDLPPKNVEEIDDSAA
jgi:hypothetical protein